MPMTPAGTTVPGEIPKRSVNACQTTRFASRPNGMPTTSAEPQHERLPTHRRASWRRVHPAPADRQSPGTGASSSARGRAQRGEREHHTHDERHALRCAGRRSIGRRSSRTQLASVQPSCSSRVWRLRSAPMSVRATRSGAGSSCRCRRSRHRAAATARRDRSRRCRDRLPRSCSYPNPRNRRGPDDVQLDPRPVDGSRRCRRRGARVRPHGLGSKRSRSWRTGGGRRRGSGQGSRPAGRYRRPARPRLAIVSRPRVRPAIACTPGPTQGRLRHFGIGAVGPDRGVSSSRTGAWS